MKELLIKAYKDISRRTVDDLNHANKKKGKLQEDSHNGQIGNH